MGTQTEHEGEKQMTEKQLLLQEIERELKDMTEEEKQGVLNFLWNAPSRVCKEERGAV